MVQQRSGAVARHGGSEAMSAAAASSAALPAFRLAGDAAAAGPVGFVQAGKQQVCESCIVGKMRRT